MRRQANLAGFGENGSSASVLCSPLIFVFDSNPLTLLESPRWSGKSSYTSPGNVYFYFFIYLFNFFCLFSGWEY